jgi:uncharacterized membrane protein
MSGLLIVFLLFIALHSIPAIPSLREKIIGAIGRRTYLIVYSLVSTAVLIWLFYEALNTDYIELWQPEPWQAWVTLILAPVGLFFVLTGLISPNPFSISLRRSDGAPGAITTITRHPVLIGFLFWAIGHIVPNGDLRSAILFGGFALFSLGGIAMTERRSRKRMGDHGKGAVEKTSIVPFAACFRSPVDLRIDLSMIIGLVLSAMLTIWLLSGAHAEFFGADPLLAVTD